ncbi:hypothetical protein BC833DRAFT_629827 [Globomyces pollinis-pini]|nr:hypothetical protein BC833DRAFT_629827 [Globomyces pollinis-pini]
MDPPYCRDSSKDYMKRLPVEIKQMIVEYLPVSSLLNFRLSAKEMNLDYHFGQVQLLKLYQSKKLFNSSSAFKCYLKYNPPVYDDFQDAIWQNKVDIVRVLLEDTRLNPNANDNWAITMASMTGLTEIVQKLLNDKRVDPSARDNYAIIFGSEYGRTGIVHMLLQDERVDPSADDNYPVRIASKSGYIEIILLSDKRVDPTTDHNYAFRSACKNGHTEIMVYHEVVSILPVYERLDIKNMILFGVQSIRLLNTCLILVIFINIGDFNF